MPRRYASAILQPPAVRANKQIALKLEEATNQTFENARWYPSATEKMFIERPNHADKRGVNSLQGLQISRLMATKLESPPPLDGEKLLADCDDEASFANRCLHIFVRNTQVDMDGISTALDRRDFCQITTLAHRIKGASASIRAEFLQQQAARLEALGGKKELAAVSECFVRLQAEFEHFKSFVATLPLLPD